MPFLLVTLIAAVFLAVTPQGADVAVGPAKPDPVHDIVVYGDSSGAVIAAIAAKREGCSAIWVNPTGFPGGMTASGRLGATDFLGRRNTFGGIASEFYDRLAEGDYTIPGGTEVIIIRDLRRGRCLGCVFSNGTTKKHRGR